MFGSTDVQLTRDQLLSTPSTNLGCLRVVPIGKKSRQKMVVGDTVGVVHCFSVDKHHEIKMEYESASMEKPITRIQLLDEKAYVSSGGKITAFTRKGREFLTMETNLSEVIASIQVRVSKIWTAGAYILTQFEKAEGQAHREVCFTMCPDRINDIYVDDIFGNEQEYEVFLACQDRHLRVVRGPTITAELGVEGPCSVVTRFPAGDGSREILYGTLNGVISGCRVNNSGLSRRYVVENTRRAGSVMALHTLDFLKEGLPGTIVVARDDGMLDLYSLDPSGVPRLVHSESLQETVTGLDGGYIVSTHQEDIVFNTYSGKVMALINSYDETKANLAPGVRTSTTSGTTSGLSQESLTRSEETKKRIAVLRQEIEDIRKKVEIKKTDYSNSISNSHVSVAPAFSVRDKFALDSNGSWLLTLELNTPIECVEVQSDVDIELIDTDIPAILSTTVPDQSVYKKTKMLAVYRLSETSHRLEMRVRALEGQLGTIRAFIIPSTQPKAAQMRTYIIKPLALHQRLSVLPQLTFPVNTLRLTGTFTVNDMHAWVSLVLPEVSEVVHGQEAAFGFVSTFQETHLVCKYRKGEAEFYSENLSALSVLKQVTTREATQRKIAVKINVDFKPETVQRVLDLLHVKLNYQHHLAERVKVIQALQEIEMQEQDISFLSADYLETLKKAKELEKEVKVQPKRLEYLHNIVRRLMTDVYALRGESPLAKMPQLQQHLERYDLHNMKEFFKHL